jgi:hypothetical protein
MTEGFEKTVYSQEVIAFTSTANAFCAALESVNDVGRRTFLENMQKILPDLYLKVLLLPELENIFEEGNEKFVTIDDWNTIHDGILIKLGQFDDYLEVFDKKIEESEEPVTRSISEDLADIYQDIKDFLMLYRVGTNELMNDAIWECRQNFETYWGQKLVNVIRAIHNLIHHTENLDENEDHTDVPTGIDPENVDTRSWLINKRFDDFKDGDK